MTKLWQKDYEVETLIERFTVGKDRELDEYLAEFDVLGSLAHSRMLESIGLLSKTELSDLQKELKNIYQKIKAGEFEIQEGVEDVHSQVELLLTEKLGETGKKIHAGRSRNDQVMVDLKLYLRHAIQKLVSEIEPFFKLLIELSETHKNVLMAGYTHTQIAMPSSFGLWFGAYAESLVDDLLLFQTAYRVVNQNPLGSAAGYGSSFPLNRQMTTDLLGFESLNYNSVYAQMGRGKSEKIVAYALAGVASTLGKMADDVCFFMSQNLNFLTFPDELTTGSSIMPHKKNPDVFELLRARCNRLQALPNEITLVLTNLISGYHRDLQLIKEDILPALDELSDCLSIAKFTLAQVQVNPNILEDEKYRYLFSVESVNKEVLDGVSFREAYRKIGKQITDGTFEPKTNIQHTHEGSIGNLENAQISARFHQIIAEFQFDKSDKIYELLD